jgi:Site-specific recombinase XerD
LLLACHPLENGDVSAEQAAARNRAILWVLAETGMRVSAVCGLCLADVDREHGRLIVREKGARQRQLALGQDGLRALLSYLDDYRSVVVACCERTGACEDHLFLSETCRSLTDNGIALVFSRLRKSHDSQVVHQV